MEGLLLVDKPAGLTSFGVVARVRRISGVKKVGHAGTLDPMATGLLIIMIGKGATRQADRFLKLDKSYEAELTLGANSDTADAEGNLIPVSDSQPSSEEVEGVLDAHIGEQQQTPPIYSAIKVGGQRAYKLAREGKPVELKPRTVQIYSLDECSYEYPKLRFKVSVSSGTYIRSLAEDIGTDLKTGAYLSGLRRLSIGEYSVTSAVQIEGLTSEQITQALLPLDQ